VVKPALDRARGGRGRPAPTTFTPATDGEALHVGDTVQTDGVGLAEID